MKIFCIGDEDIITGFRFSGIEGKPVFTTPDARTVFNEVVNNPEIGILLISDTLAQAIEYEITEYQKTNLYPIIVEIPDLIGGVEGKKSLIELIREAIGIRV